MSGGLFCVGIFIEWGFNGGGRRITEVAGILAKTSVKRVRISMVSVKDYGSSRHSCQNFRKLSQVLMAAGEGLRKWRASLLKLP